MQKKFGSLMDEKLLARARDYCSSNNTSISWLLEESLREFLTKKDPKAGGPSSVQASFGAFPVNAGTLKHIMEEDLYDLE
jgi:hypothetical protein